MRITRRPLITAALAMPFAARAQSRAWPNRPVRIIIPYAPGGPVEIPGRFIAEHLSSRLGQPFVVETRPGAGGAVGTKQVIAATDQHTLLMVTGAVAIQPAVQPDIGYDPVAELVPISTVSEASLGLMVRPNAPFRDLPGLVAAAKARPGEITYVSSGNGTTTHMSAALFGSRAGITWQHVPYRGGGQLISGFLAGDVDVMSGDLATLLPHVREGRGVLLGVSAPRRLPILPDTPTFAEAVPGTGITIWFALFAPRGFPEDAIGRITGEFGTLRDSPLAARMAEAGGTLLLTGPDDLSARLRRELPLWRQVVADAGIKPE